MATINIPEVMFW